MTQLSTTLAGATADEVATLTAELRPGKAARVDVRRRRRRGNDAGAGRALCGGLADAGVQTAIVRLADVGRKPDAIARFAGVIAAFAE